MPPSHVPQPLPWRQGGPAGPPPEGECVCVSPRARPLGVVGTESLHACLPLCPLSCLQQGPRHIAASPDVCHRWSLAGWR